MKTGKGIFESLEWTEQEIQRHNKLDYMQNDKCFIVLIQKNFWNGKKNSKRANGKAKEKSYLSSKQRCKLHSLNLFIMNTRTLSTVHPAIRSPVGPAEAPLFRN